MPRRRERSQSEPLNQTDASSFPNSFHGGHRTIASQGDWSNNGMRFLNSRSKGHLSEFKYVMPISLSYEILTIESQVIRDGHRIEQPIYTRSPHRTGRLSFLSALRR